MKGDVIQVRMIFIGKQSDGKTYIIPTGNMPHYYYKIDGDHVYELVSSGKGDGTVPIGSLHEVEKYPLLTGWLATNLTHHDDDEVSVRDPEKYSEAIKFTL